MKKTELIQNLCKICFSCGRKQVNGVYISEFTDGTGKAKVETLYIDEGQAGIILSNGYFIQFSELTYNELYKIYNKVK